MSIDQQDFTPGVSTLRIAATDMAALKVRIRGSNRPDPPEFFYQCLPSEGIVFLATLPRAGIAVSIPGEGSWRGGWPFTTAPPESASGLVVIYQLQPDCRYTAVAVRENGHDYPLDEFIEIAEHRTQDQFGNLEKIPGLYIHAAPDKEKWESILRDDGYAALNPENFQNYFTMPVLPSSPVPHSSEAERFGHTLQIRAQLYSGDKLPARNPLPVFSRVEIAIMKGECQEVIWLDFDEYRNMRARLTVVPGTIADGFSEWITRLTDESGFDRWRFRPGMTFDERTEWWGPRGRRRTIHEGLDFVEGFRGGEVSLISEGVPVRAIASGKIVAALDDFMGKTVIVRHTSLTMPGGEVFHTLLSHIRMEEHLPTFVNKGEMLGRVGRRAGVHIHPHLHLTGAWFPADFPFAKAGIGTIIHPGFTPAILTDFNSLIKTNPLCVMSLDDKEFLS